MEGSFSKTPRRLVMLGGVVALVAAIGGSGVVFATPAGGATATSTVIADGMFANAVNINTDPIKLRT
jgi:hypothetical protein